MKNILVHLFVIHSIFYTVFVLLTPHRTVITTLYCRKCVSTLMPTCIKQYGVEHQKKDINLQIRLNNNNNMILCAANALFAVRLWRVRFRRCSQIILFFAAVTIIIRTVRC